MHISPPEEMITELNDFLKKEKTTRGSLIYRQRYKELAQKYNLEIKP